MNIIILLPSIVSIFYFLYFIYLFQIKEYRFDRIKVTIQELGFFRFFINTPFKLPAKTFRNILVGFFSFLIYMYIYRGVMLTNSQILFLLLALFTPFISFSIVSICVIATSVLTYIKRRQIILKAKQKIERSKTVFIGITGSYGKTTTKELLFNLLSTSFKVAKTDNNMNTDVGVALSVIQNLKPDTEFFIVEMGAYKRGEVKAICDFVKPTYGIITGIGNQHLALFGSIDTIIQTKAELLNSLPTGGIGYVNNAKGAEYFRKQARCNIVSFGEKNANITFNEVSKENKLLYKITYNNHTFMIDAFFPKQFLSNILSIIGLSTDLGITPSIINQTLPPLIKNKFGQLIRANKQGMHIIDFSYNANVEGFIAAIEFIQSLKSTNRIIISRGIIELGVEKVNSYKRIITQLNESNILFFTTDPLFHKLSHSNNIILFNTETQILTKINTYQSHTTSICIIGRFSQKFMKQLSNK